MKIDIVVQTCPQRRESIGPTLDSIRASDISNDFEVMMHPDGTVTFDFFLSVIRRMRDSGADYAVRLEDDVLVNQHFIHNVRTWPALAEPNFGAGWLFASQGILDDGGSLALGRRSRAMYRTTRELHCGLAVMFPVPLMGELYDRMSSEEWDLKDRQDLSMSASVWDVGKRCYLHSPPLAENRMIPSARNHTDHTLYGHAAGPYFDVGFKRPSSGSTFILRR